MTEKRIYHKRFEGMRGLDLSAAQNEISRFHFADLENMWRDPARQDSDLTESFPGYRLFAKFPSPIYGIYTQNVSGKNYLVVHADNRLYRFESSLCDHAEDVAALSPVYESLPRQKGCAFASGDSLYFLIGGCYYRLTASGELKNLSEYNGEAYVPVTYYNGEPYEQRNLMTDIAKNVFTADGDYKVKSGASEELSFAVTNEAAKTCCVSGSEALKDAFHIDIPEKVLIGEESYTVTSVASDGFKDFSSLVTISFPETITFIGHMAFRGCLSLFSVRLPNSVKEIGSKVFLNCSYLSRVHFGNALESYGVGVFDGCSSLSEVSLGITQESYQALAQEYGNLIPENVQATFEALTPEEQNVSLYRYPLREKVVSVKEVLLNDVPLGLYFSKMKNGYILYRVLFDQTSVTHVEILTTQESLLENKNLTVKLSLSDTVFTSPKGYTDFGSSHPELIGRMAVCACRMAASYDGRVFLSGNPALPNTVFHTLPDETGRNNPSYIGALSYFNDGTASVPNGALLSTENALIVLKSDRNGEGSLFYHTAESTGISFIPRIYPSSCTEGVGAVGDAVHFKDDPVFLGKDGLLSVEKQSLNLERSIRVRSLPINAKLLKEDLSNASMAVHEGVLYLLCEGNAYLADSKRYLTHKDGTRGYEWYLITKIGSYTNDSPLYRTTSFLPEGAEAYGVTVAPKEGEPAKGTVFSVRLPSGAQLYYEKREDGACYAVDTEGERTGGDFSPAHLLCAAGERLFFATRDGSLGVFNTDKRGKSLYALSESPLYAKKGDTFFPSRARNLSRQSEDALEFLPLFEKNGESYTPVGEAWVYIDGGYFSLAHPLGERVSVNEIHRYFYTYGAHAYTAACTLAPDDGNMPHCTKDTLPRSAAARVKTPRGGAFSVLIRTDKTPWHVLETVSAGSADFGDFDFAALDFHGEESISLPLREKEKRWCFKQYRFVSDKARQPFGVYNLCYSYRLSGWLKN